MYNNFSYSCLAKGEDVENYYYFGSHSPVYLLYDYKNYSMKKSTDITYYSDIVRIIHSLPIQNKAKLTNQELMFFKKELNAKI